jgi:nitrogen fixation protein NifZ
MSNSDPFLPVTDVEAGAVAEDQGQPQRPGFIPPREPKYEWGMAVRAAADLINDGSYPEQPEGALLVTLGTVGEIIRIGHMPEANNTPVYLVEFPGGMLVGCLEEEIVPVLGERTLAPGVMGAL